MKNLYFIYLFSLLTPLKISACDCECIGDCSFHKIVKTAKFVALVKVVSYDSYLIEKIDGQQGKMPESMIVEVIKKYKGAETRQKITIWGDNGSLCRPYLSRFLIGDYLLIAPEIINGPNAQDDSKPDYTFFTCSTDYLKVDMIKNTAVGLYTNKQTEIILSDFEKTMKECENR